MYISSKKGSSGTNVLLTVLVIVIIAFAGSAVYWMYGQQQATAVSTPEGKEAVKETAQLAKTGKLAYLNIVAEDQTSDTKAKASVPLYCWEEGTPNIYLDNANADATKTTDVQQVITKVGATVHCRAFNTTWYSDELVHTMTSEAENDVLKVYHISNSLKMRWKYEGSFNQNNLTATASGSAKYDLLEIEQNFTDRAYDLWGIAFDQPSADANLTDVEIGSTLTMSSGNVPAGGMPTLSESTRKISRIKDTADFVFVLSTPLRLLQDDAIQTGTVRFTADGDGCPATGDGELWDVYAIDTSAFKSSVDSTIKYGEPEDDQPSPTDIGGSDFSPDANYNIYCRAS